MFTPFIPSTSQPRGRCRTIARVAALALVAGIASSSPSFAQEAAHKLGDHPAVIVKQQWASRGYDYAAQFYPHPAWLYLASEAPKPETDDPARFAKTDEATARVAVAPALHNVSTAAPYAP